MLPAAMTPVGGPCSSAAVLTVCPTQYTAITQSYHHHSHSLSRRGQALATAVTASSPW